jgi:hypothetical protein
VRISSGVGLDRVAVAVVGGVELRLQRSGRFGGTWKESRECRVNITARLRMRSVTSNNRPPRSCEPYMCRCISEKKSGVGRRRAPGCPWVIQTWNKPTRGGYGGTAHQVMEEAFVPKSC